jgi:DNA-binding transcriptional regulator YiaG
MKKCVLCGGSRIERRVEQIPFNQVALVEGVVYTCMNCKERFEGFERVEELGKVVAHHIARRVERLAPAEIRYLRKYLGYSSADLAAFLGVSPETVSRWESDVSPKPMKLATEKLLRYMALNDRPISEYGLDRAGSSTAKPAFPVFRKLKGEWGAA